MPSTLRAGAARADITPHLGIQLAGDIGRHRPTEEIRDPLYANALVLDSNSQRFCLVSTDLLGIVPPWSDRIRQAISSKTGIPFENTILTVTQNHSAPAIGNGFISDDCDLFPPDLPWLRGGDERYNQPTLEKIVSAVSEAITKLEPVTFRVGRDVEGRLSFNRRFVMRDGTTRTNPDNVENQVLHVEGPTDPEIGVATFTNSANKVIAALLHFTCHPTFGYPTRYVIGDWPGAWAENMRNHWGEQSVPLVINGCCGNIRHTNPLDRKGGLRDYRVMAKMLMEPTMRAIESMRVVDPGMIRMARNTLKLPLRALTADELSESQQMFKDHPTPLWNEPNISVKWDWVYAAMRLDLHETRKRDPLFPYEIQALRIGDLALLSLMGEPFVESQLEIKLKSPVAFTWPIHFCNGYAGYIPTRHAFKGGGYETRTSNGSKFEHDALEKITAGCLELLRSLG